MPVFNAEAYLAAAIDSILAQSLGDFELLVIDDGSTDGSWSIIDRYTSTDPRIRARRRGNLGVVATRNELLALARAEWVVWMDADDLCLPTRLQLQHQFVQQEPDLICLGSFAQCIDPAGNKLNLESYPTAHADITRQQWQGGAMRFATTMMRRDLAIGVGGFRAPFRMGEDFDLLLRMSERGAMANLALPLYLYRQHVASACSVVGADWAVYRAVVIELARERRATGSDRLQRGEAVSMPLKMEPVGRRSVANMYSRWSLYANHNEDYLLACRYALQSALRWPLSFKAWQLMLLSAARVKAVNLEAPW